MIQTKREKYHGGKKHRKRKTYPIFEESFCIHPCWDPKGLATQQALLLLFGSPKELVFSTKTKNQVVKYIQKATHLETHRLRSKTNNKNISQPNFTTTLSYFWQMNYYTIIWEHTIPAYNWKKHRLQRQTPLNSSSMFQLYWLCDPGKTGPSEHTFYTFLKQRYHHPGWGLENCVCEVTTVAGTLFN